MPTITYQEVYDAIKAALSERTEGTLVKVADHEAAEILILDYLQQLIDSGVSASGISEAHATGTADQNTDLVWDEPFDDTNYSFIVNAFDTNGTPVVVELVSKLANKIVVKPYTNASHLYALAKAHPGEEH